MTKIVQQYVDIWADRWKGRRQQAIEPPIEDGEWGDIVTKMKNKWGDKREWNTSDNERFAGGKVAFEVTSKEGTWNHGYFKGSRRDINTKTGEVVVYVPLHV